MSGFDLIHNLKSGWYNHLGQDAIDQRRIWTLSTEDEQLTQFKQLLQDFPERSLNLMFEAARKGKLQIVKFLFGQGVKATANAEEGDDKTLVPLHAAAYHGHLDVVKYFVQELKLSPNMLDGTGMTPVMRACSGSHVDVLKYLLSQAAVDILVEQPPGYYNSVANYGVRATAFHFAAGMGSSECINALLDFAQEHGIDQSALITTSVIESAAGSENPEILRLLLGKTECDLPAESTVNFTNDTCFLTPEQKTSIEAAFIRAVRDKRINNIQFLYAYLTSSSPSGAPNFPALGKEAYYILKNETLCIPTGEHTSGRYINRAIEQTIPLFTQIQKILFDPRLATTDILSERDTILGDAFFNAVKADDLHFMKHIINLFPNINPNHLTKFAVTPLYRSVSAYQDDILKWLHSTFNNRIDPHVGNGQFANGPTALVSALRPTHNPTT